MYYRLEEILKLDNDIQEVSSVILLLENINGKYNDFLRLEKLTHKQSGLETRIFLLAN